VVTSCDSVLISRGFLWRNRFSHFVGAIHFPLFLCAISDLVFALLLRIGRDPARSIFSMRAVWSWVSLGHWY
jgi:hypothetical protein